MLLFEHEDNKQLKSEFDVLMSKLVNPFTLMRRWLKFELLELEAIFEAIN